MSHKSCELHFKISPLEEKNEEREPKKEKEKEKQKHKKKKRENKIECYQFYPPPYSFR